MRLWDYISPVDPMSLMTSGDFVVWGSRVLIIVALILLYRHSVLTYGAHMKGGESLVLFAIWMIIPQATAADHFTALLLLLFLLAPIELVITSFALHRTPYMTFNVGLGLGILSLVHPVYIILAPFIYVQLREINLSSRQHTSSYILGILCAWWLTLLVMAEPTLSGISTFMMRHTRGIIAISLPPRDLWVPTAIYFVMLLYLTFRTAGYFSHAINRYRWGVVTHLWIAWLCFTVWVLYGCSVTSLFVASLFFTCAGYSFLAGRDGDNLFTRLFVLILSLGAVIYTIALR